jgi:hypothetical protein
VLLSWLRLALHGERAFVRPQTEECGMAQVPSGGPLDEPDLRDDFRRQPARPNLQTIAVVDASVPDQRFVTEFAGGAPRSATPATNL